MIKRRLLAAFIVSIILVAMICSNASAAAGDTPGTPSIEQITSESEKVQKLLDELEGIKSESDPAAQVWNKYIENTTMGKAAIKLGLVLKKADPVFNIVPGLPFSWTGLFFMSLITMLTIFMLIRGFLSVTRMPKYATWLLAIGATAALSFLWLFRLFGKAIVNPINLISSIWVRIIVYIIVGALIVYLGMFALKFRKGEEKQRALKKEITAVSKKTAEKEVKKEEAKAEKKEEERAAKEGKTPESIEEKAGKRFLQRLGESLSRESSTPSPSKPKVEGIEKPFD